MKKKPKEYRIVKKTAQNKLGYKKEFYTIEELKYYGWWRRKNMKWIAYDVIIYNDNAGLWRAQTYNWEFEYKHGAKEYIDYLLKNKTILYKGTVIEEVRYMSFGFLHPLFIIKSNPLYVPYSNSLFKKAYEGSKNLAWLKQQIAKKVDKLEEITITAEVLE